CRRLGSMRFVPREESTTAHWLTWARGIQRQVGCNLAHSGRGRCVYVNGVAPHGQSEVPPSQPPTNATDQVTRPKGGVTKRSQHRRRPCGSRRSAAGPRPRKNSSARGLWGGFEELCSEKPGAGPPL